MKICKKAFVLFVTLMIMVSSTMSIYADCDESNDRLSFTRNGNKLIYSNSPEAFTSSSLNSSYGGYTISQYLTPYQNYDAEYYHWNQTGSTLRIGVMICNTNSTSKTVTVYSNNASAKTTSASQRGADVAAQMIADYWNGAGTATTYNIPAYSVQFINYEDVDNWRIASGKVLFKTTSSGMYCKVACVKTSDLSQAISVPKCTYVSPFTTAVFDHDNRYAYYNYNTNSNHRFYTNMLTYSSPANTNFNEHEDASYSEATGSVYDSDGNYGVTYYINLANCVGKTMTITPDWESLDFYGYTRDSYAIYDGNTWKAITIYDYQESYSFTITSNTFKFLLPGGGTGNVKFEID